MTGERLISRTGVPTARGRCPCTCPADDWVTNSCEQEPCCSECDPQPCAYEILLPCEARYFDYAVDPDDPSPDDWIAYETITFRQDCVSPNEGCVFYALGATGYYGVPYRSWCGSIDIGGGCSTDGHVNCNHAGYNTWGMDWCVVDPGQCVPCTWRRSTVPSALGQPHYWVQFDLESRTVSQATGFSPSTTFPTYNLVDGATWDCYGCNVLKTTDTASAQAWGLPTYLAIRAKDVPAAHFCDETGAQAELDCGYSSKSELCDCADPCCDCITQLLWLTCDDCTVSSTGTACRGIRDGVLCPDNPSYTRSITGCDQELSVTWYCCSGTWYADIYLNGDFCETIDLGPPVSTCPLVIGTGQSGGCDLLPCDSVCIGIGESCSGCCDVPPDTLYATLTPVSGCGCTTPIDFTINTSGANEWQSTPGSVTYCSDKTLFLTLSCSAGNWSVDLVGGAQCTGDDDATVTAGPVLNEVDCNDVLLIFNGIELCGFNENGVNCVFNLTITS